jgi:hypothetical protein
MAGPAWARTGCFRDNRRLALSMHTVRRDLHARYGLQRPSANFPTLPRSTTIPSRLDTISGRLHPPFNTISFIHDIFFIQRGVGHRWVSSHGSRLHHRHWDGVFDMHLRFPRSFSLSLFILPEDLHTSIVIGSIIIWKHRWNNTMNGNCHGFEDVIWCMCF